MSLFGGALSLAGSLIGGSKASSGGREGSRLAEFSPYGITSGLGSATFDQANKTGAFRLSAPYQNQRDYYLNQSDFFNSQLNPFRSPTRADFTTGQTGYQATKTLDDFRNEFGVGQGQDPRPYVKDGTAYVSQGMFDRFGGQNTNLYREIMRYGGIPNDIISGDMDVAVDPNLQATGGGSEQDALDAYNRYLEGAGLSGGVFDEAGYNAALAGYVSPEQRIYNRLFKLSEGNEALEKSGLENRLFSQGMLGSTGGAHRLNAQSDAANTRDLARQHQAVTLSEEIQNQIQNRGIRASNQALGIDQAGLENLRLGIAAGGGNVGAGQLLANNAANQGGAIANAFSAFGDNFGGLFGQQGTQPSSVPNGGYGIPNKPFGVFP